MKVERSEGIKERSILIGMVTNTKVLKRIVPRWPKKGDGLCSATWSNIVGTWCVKYFSKYSKAPGRQIENLFQTWAEDNKDATTVKLVEKFLGSLSTEYAKSKKINADFLVDMAGAYFDRVSLERLTRQMQAHLDVGKVEEARKVFASYKKVDLGTGTLIDVLQDSSALEEVFTERPESLVKYRGAMGRFMGRSLCRDGFVGIMAPMKKGKTWWLIDMAWRAMLQRRRVVYFQAGDLTRRQMMTRLAVRGSEQPFEPQTVQYPKSFTLEGDKASLVPYNKVFKHQLDFSDSERAFNRLMTEKIRSRDSFFKLGVYSTRTLTMDTVLSSVEDLAYAGWTPDIVFIDYADILSPPAGFVGESRDAVNHNWMMMRRISQEFHCLMVTATQSNAASFKAESLDMSHFAEDNRKFAHVTGMLALSQNADEKENGITRLGWVVLREEKFSISKFVHAAGCLEIANPCVKSVM